jgi:hypothetical protein
MRWFATVWAKDGWGYPAPTERTESAGALGGNPLQSVGCYALEGSGTTLAAQSPELSYGLEFQFERAVRPSLRSWRAEFIGRAPR